MFSQFELDCALTAGADADADADAYYSVLVAKENEAAADAQVKALQEQLDQEGQL